MKRFLFFIKSVLVGFVRVSSLEQDTKRSELDALLVFISESDTVVVHSMDRLARNLDDLRKLVQDLTQRGIEIEFLKEGIVFSDDD